ncbi:virion structural protein [Vibrio phage BONAISHI]|nr:virion structural protein [Vibrio phage BONAISHI]
MNTKKAVDYLIGIVKQLPNGAQNAKLYTELFKGFKEEDFRALKKRYEEEDFVFPIFVYNMDKEKIDVDKVMEIGKKEGVKFFQKITITDPLTGEPYQSPIEYLILDLPVRRPIQHLVKKMSVSEGRSVDHLAGQATGDTKAAGISKTELVQLDARNLESGPIEFIKVRGGDEAAYRHMREQIKQTGGFSLAPIMDLGTKPKAVDTLKSFLLGRNLKPEGLG